MRRRHLIGRVAASCSWPLSWTVSWTLVGAFALASAAVAAERDAAVSPRATTAIADSPQPRTAILAGEPIQVAQSGGTTGRELEPAYPAPPPGDPGPYNESERKVYNSDYLFASTRAVANSTIVPAGKAPLFLLTVPVDLVCLPIAMIAGFFG